MIQVSLIINIRRQGATYRLLYIHRFRKHKVLAIQKVHLMVWKKLRPVQGLAISHSLVREKQRGPWERWSEWVVSRRAPCVITPHYDVKFSLRSLSRNKQVWFAKGENVMVMIANDVCIWLKCDDSSLSSIYRIMRLR